MSIKEELYRQCHEFVENRLQVIQSTILEIQQSLASETKSSAGDKHETGRAMLQLEREKTGKQLAEIIKIKEALSKIDILKRSDNVSIGSLVYTSESNYFIAISAGELKLDDGSYYAISPHTPIGQLLIGKELGDTIVFREQVFVVQKIT